MYVSYIYGGCKSATSRNPALDQGIPKFGGLTYEYVLYVARSAGLSIEVLQAEQ